MEKLARPSDYVEFLWIQSLQLSEDFNLWKKRLDLFCHLKHKLYGHYLDWFWNVIDVIITFFFVHTPDSVLIKQQFVLFQWLLLHQGVIFVDFAGHLSLVLSVSALSRRPLTDK